MTNIVAVSLAYRAAVIALMTTQFNWIAARLDLAGKTPIGPTDVTAAFVADPRIVPPPHPATLFATSQLARPVSPLRASPAASGVAALPLMIGS